MQVGEGLFRRDRGLVGDGADLVRSGRYRNVDRLPREGEDLRELVDLKRDFASQGARLHTDRQLDIAACGCLH